MTVLETLLERHRVWRGGAPSGWASAEPTGYAELDAQLPGGGWPCGALTEVLGHRAGIGELQMVLPALARLTWGGKRVVWLAPPHLPYAPALAAAGINLAHLVLVRAPGRRDALWAAEQVLRAASCHALLAWFPVARYEELRRLAVAAEASRAWVALFRPHHSAQDASPAALRLALDPADDALVVRILKRRGAPAASPLRLAVNRPIHALGCTAFSLPASGRARDDRCLELPVHP